MPDIEQGDLPGARSREHPSPAKGVTGASSCGGFYRLILSWNIRGWDWLPTEGEKVEFIEGLGVHSNLIPRRIYYGAVRAQKRYFALKLPVAGGDKTVTFAYVDPGRESTGELNSWGAAHGPLWDAIRAKGRRVEVIAIGAELDDGFAGGSSATALGGGGAGEGDRGVDGEAGD